MGKVFWTPMGKTSSYVRISVCCCYCCYSPAANNTWRTGTCISGVEPTC